MRSPTMRTLVALAAIVVATPTLTSAQQRRMAPPGSREPNGGASGARREPVGLPRFPFVGAWEGELQMKPQGEERGQPVPITMVFDLSDTTKVQYSGATIFPGDARAPHLKTVASNAGLQWEQRNSGRGMFAYTARLAGKDSIVGTVILRDSDWPTPPTGTFVLVRKPTNTRRGS